MEMWQANLGFFLMVPTLERVNMGAIVWVGLFGLVRKRRAIGDRSSSVSRKCAKVKTSKVAVLGWIAKENASSRARREIGDEVDDTMGYSSPVLLHWRSKYLVQRSITNLSGSSGRKSDTSSMHDSTSRTTVVIVSIPTPRTNISGISVNVPATFTKARRTCGEDEVESRADGRFDLHVRSVGRANMNEESSRSHTVFILRIHGVNEVTKGCWMQRSS
nr:kinesin-like protein KIN-14C [Tanacetum cinerariifolium]